MVQMRALLIFLLVMHLPANASLAETEWPKHYLPALQMNGQQPMTSTMADPLLYHGRAVQVEPRIYLVFWGWFGVDPMGEAPVLISFFEGVGGSQWASTLGEYGETQRGGITNPAGQLAGVWWDDALPTQGGLHVTSENVNAEVERAVEYFGYHPDANYVIAIPTKRNDPFFAIPGGFCAWHSTTTDAQFRNIAHTYLPYIPDAPASSCGANFVNPGPAGLLDGVTIVAGHEYAETITDPDRGGGWLDVNGLEVSDKCVWIQSGPAAAYNLELSTGTFPVQTLWSNHEGGCSRG